MHTTVFYDLTIKHIVNTALSEKLLPIAKKFLADPSRLTNEWGYKNTYTEDEGLSTQPELQFFTDFILKKAKNYFNEKNILIKDDLKLWTSLFTSEMVQGDEHQPHNHPGALLSGLIYLQVPKNSSNLEFFHPRHTSIAWRNLIKESSYTFEDDIFQIKQDSTIVVKPTPGLFLFWESWANHRVPKNQSADKRITMVFNIGAENV